MALIPITHLIDTIITFIEEQRPIYETIIDQFWEGRSLSILVGRRTSIPASSLPSIEVEPVSETLGWHACRVQEEKPSLELDITTDNGNPEQAVRAEARLVSLTTRILATPQHLRPLLSGTRIHMYDSLPAQVRYGKAGQGRMRVATISYSGKQLEFLANKLFPVGLQPLQTSVEPVL